MKAIYFLLVLYFLAVAFAGYDSCGKKEIVPYGDKKCKCIKKAGWKCCLVKCCQLYKIIYKECPKKYPKKYPSVLAKPTGGY